MHAWHLGIGLIKPYHFEHFHWDISVQCAYRLLEWLCQEGLYKSEDLKVALEIADGSIDELPCCALLSQYLPGPRHSAYELCHSDSPFPMGSGMVATTLQARYQDTCPSLNYWGLAGAATRDTMKVTASVYLADPDLKRSANVCAALFRQWQSSYSKLPTKIGLAKAILQSSDSNLDVNFASGEGGAQREDACDAH